MVSFRYWIPWPIDEHVGALISLIFSPHPIHTSFDEYHGVQGSADSLISSVLDEIYNFIRQHLRSKQDLL
jgi:hypothetical protein